MRWQKIFQTDVNMQIIVLQLLLKLSHSFSIVNYSVIHTNYTSNHRHTSQAWRLLFFIIIVFNYCSDFVVISSFSSYTFIHSYLWRQEERKFWKRSGWTRQKKESTARNPKERTRRKRKEGEGRTRKTGKN